MKASLSGSRDETNEGHHRSVERVIAAMPEHLQESLSLQDMAEIALMSPFHFNRVFRQIAGIPPTQFLYALRLQKAKQLLLTTDLRVTDVCYEVGYNSLGTFTTRFTQLVGLTPCRWRLLAKQVTGVIPELTAGNGTGKPNPLLRAQWISGRIDSVKQFTGLVFIGLFTTPIPQDWPVAGTLLTELGDYNIGPIPDGSYYIFAAAFPQLDDPLSYLLPESSELLVGGAQTPILMQNGQPVGRSDMTLRPMRLTDPPILIALPALLAR